MGLRIFIISLIFFGCTQERSNELDSEIRNELAAIRLENNEIRFKLSELEHKLELTQVSSEAVTKVKIRNKPDYSDDVLFGNLNSKKGIVAFVDYSSQASIGFLSKVFPGLRAKPDIFVAIKDFPLAKNPKSIELAEALNCAGEQGLFLDYLSTITENSTVPDNLINTKHSFCMDSDKYLREIAKDIEDGKLFGVKSVPTLLLFNKDKERHDAVIIRGAQPLSIVTEALNTIDD